MLWTFPVICVEDHTPSDWPVVSVIEKLDDGSGLDFRFKTKCPGTQVIRIYTVSSVKGSAVGETKIKAVEGKPTQISSVKINIERSYGKGNAAARRAVIAYQIGYAIGMRASTRAADVMYYKIDKNYVYRWSDAELRWIRKYYGK